MTDEVLYSNLYPKEQSFSQLIIDLSYLIERSYIRITFKQIGKIAALRIYLIPSDISGIRYIDFLRQIYRNNKPVSWHNSRFKDIMKKLITILDYSLENWESGIFNSGLLFNSLNDFKKFDAKNLGKTNYFNIDSDSDLNFHIDRLIKNKEFAYLKLNKISKNLESRLSEIYDSIKFNDDYKKYYNQVSLIQDLKSSLYKYQIESISKMAFKESNISNNLMPNLLKINRNPSFYLDLLEFSFQNSPEFYESSRGGILAENMGLGKTLICLSLIVLTKFEISEIPEDFIERKVKDPETIPLLDQCVRTINRSSIPWRTHLNQLPQNCINKLENKPGFFYYKRSEHPKLDLTKIHSRSRPIIMEEKLLLSSTTLIIAPDNLFNQWSNEIKKHLLPNSLKILKLNKNQVIPKALDLIKFDLILMSQTVFISEESSKTELNKIYWKRFIIDEGHSMNQRSSRLVDLSKELKIERKWIVSGTPTSGLTKLQMNENNDSKNHSIKRKFDAKNDLIKLGYLISNFFNIKPWSVNPELFNKFFIKPLINEDYHSNESLLNLTNLLIVRHSLNDIESDIKLPPLYHKPIYLEPSYYNKLSVNLFTTVLALNAVSSEREDKDYMFHSANKQELRRLVTNLQRSTFYWTGFSIDDLKSLITFSKTCLDKKDGLNERFYYSIEDRELLKKCIHFCKLALSDKTWRITSNIHEMTYFIDDNLYDIYSNNFGISKNNDNINIFGAPQLYSLQKFFYKNRFSNDSTVLNERVVKSSDEFWTGYWKELTNKKTEKIKNDGKSIEIANINKELDKRQHNISPIKSNTNEIKQKISKNSKILGSASSKLSYICSRLLEHQFMRVKSIIFFEFEDSAYYLTECLDILGVNYFLYSTSISQAERFEKINEFTNFKEGICLIMDLKLASFGLTITSATRVYFLNPVWNRAIEAQAIKRAHRIGQNSEVFVETLVLKDTLEEEMFNRRFIEKEDEDVNELKIPVADDAKIRDFITKFKFLKMNSNEKTYNCFKSKIIDDTDRINFKKFDNDELLEPIGKKINDEIVWDIPLFSKESQSKITEFDQKSKIKKASIKNKEFISIKEDEYNTQKEMKESPKRVRFGEPREFAVKKLRFD